MSSTPAWPGDPPPAAGDWYRRILDDLTAAVLRLGPDGRVAYANRACIELTGVPAQQSPGADLLRQVHPDDRVLAAGHLAALIAGGEPGEPREVRWRCPDGTTRWMELTGQAVPDADGLIVGFVGMLHDVTRRREHEREAQAAREQAEQAREQAERARELAERANRAKSEFLGRMSHELRTPLNAILGFAQLLELSGPQGEEAENLGHLSRAAKHLLRLVNDALDVDNIEAGRLEMALQPVSVAVAVRESLSLVRPAADAGQVLLSGLPASESGESSESGDPEPHVLADPQRLIQVLVNLLSNAVKYNRVGGRVTVDCYPLASHPQGGHPLDGYPQDGQRLDGQVAAGPDAGPGWLRIAVTDTGIGLPADRLTDVFLPFERLGAEYTEVQGTGLGLALAKSLVEAMGGRIGVQSAQGAGATFQVDLPAATPVGPHSPRAVPVPPGRGGREEPVVAQTILYVEDNQSNAMLVRRVLARRPGVQLVVAEDGVAGLAMFRRYRPDLVLLDLHLPRLDGGQVLAAIRAEPDPVLRAVPVVIVTADLTAGTEQRMVDAGASTFLAKPLDVHHLLEIVDRHVPEVEHPQAAWTGRR